MPKVVLIVEDTDTCAETLEIAFSLLQDVVCRRVRTVREARTLLDGPDPPSVLITDLHLRSASGLELIKHVRADARHAAMPILLISGDSDPDLPAKARSAGVNAFFPKPYSPGAVRRTLETFLC